MKFKLDENLPESLVAELVALDQDVDTVRQEGLAGHPDSDVWTAAQVAERFLITQDLDFSDVRKFRPGTHHGLLLIRLPEAGREALTRRIVEVFRTEKVEAWIAALSCSAGTSFGCCGRRARVCSDGCPRIILQRHSCFGYLR